MNDKSRELKRRYAQRMNELYLKLQEAQERSPEELQRVIDAEGGAQFDFLPRDVDFSRTDVVH